MPIKIQTYGYFFLKFGQIKKNNNWLDLENTIRKGLTQNNSDKSTINLEENFFNQFSYNENFSGSKVDLKSHYTDGKKFLDIKNDLKKYIRGEELRSLKENEYFPIIIESNNSKLEEIIENKNNHHFINFNYTENLFKKVSNNNNVFHIHGTTTSNIILGSNSYDPNMKKFSNKLFQFLMKERQILDNDNYCPFQLSTYENLIIIGHSCGINDYEYFFHIFDENPDINIFLCWYEYLDAEGKTKNNKESITNNFYDLIYEYERKRQNERLTKINISNKIHRVQIDIKWNCQ